MRDHRPTLTKDLLESQQLSKLQEHARQINDLNTVLKTILAPSLLEHCRAANIKDNHLVIEAASASVQMKLNYDRLNILSQLRSKGYAKLMGVEIRINPALYRGKVHQEKDEEWQEVPVSEVAAEFLKATANMPSATPKIKQRLENIAKLAEKNKQS
ncbi:conserved hypothetical protein [Vibrio nigripulchritudo MADA3029]|uniref:DUF721 domain-containing protein n=1 Tax=Vibrio nigripulchritudo TaxID=28173 RepID=UPI0003B211C5|nr:DciA family protein [Vibrio nigripulchritudo]CCN35590.1 conserved hypothetical protein [Vibrio nigripulchritudo AM115]CCN40825.1 conserved hypothetical protein [Vibrio nigripulchritudo FTn2]CCN47178.1 conserved hypothetical protein [Vibrio nigripulchritudo MADA3020]CCN55434.1 conserved hypothetical protein [Vibrio nigripulchritudo MADA3021]CCN60388.1 conserved hypothetical protein [Vibrio nigripulchritudo MADA3029]